MRIGSVCGVLLLAAMLATSLSGCITHVAEAPKREPPEPLINSLALEQCVGENGQQKCTDDSN